MANINYKRLERDIEKNIPMIIQREVKNEHIKMITITDCDLTHDLSFCKVYFTSLENIDQKEIESIVNKSTSFIRKELAKVMEMRIIPEIRFEYDTQLEYAQRIEDKIAELNK